MFTVIGLMVCAMMVGLFFQKTSLPFLSNVTTWLIWILLFILGIEVGGNRRIMEGLYTLGVEALIVALLCVLGSCFASWVLWKILYRNEIGTEATHTDQKDRGATIRGLKGSLVIVVFFVLGVAIGLLGILPFDISKTDVSFYALCCLMISVGLGIGSDPHTLRNFRSLNPRLVFLPLLTIVGTLGGALLASLILPGRTPSDCMALGSGMGYYSLSSIFITEYKGAELGTVALLSNIIREIMTLLGAPLMVRCFGRLAPIAAGGV